MRDQLLQLLQSLITGVLIALPAWSLYRLYLAPSPFFGFLAVLTIATATTWLNLTRPQTPDQPVPKPDTPKWLYAQDQLHVSVDWNDGHTGIFSDLRISKEQFIAWCAGIAAGRSMGENHWTGSRGVFSKAEYHSFRDEMISRGFLRKCGRHHAQGFELTGKGAALCNEVAKRAPSRQSPPGFAELAPGLRARE